MSNKSTPHNKDPFTSVLPTPRNKDPFAGISKIAMDFPPYLHSREGSENQLGKCCLCKSELPCDKYGYKKEFYLISRLERAYPKTKCPTCDGEIFIDFSHTVDSYILVVNCDCRKWQINSELLEDIRNHHPYNEYKISLCPDCANNNTVAEIFTLLKI